MRVAKERRIRRKARKARQLAIECYTHVLGEDSFWVIISRGLPGDEREEYLADMVARRAALAEKAELAKLP